MRWRTAGLLVLAVAACAACQAEAKRAVAQEYADRYLEALRDERIDQAMSMYSDEFFRGTPQQKWRSRLDEVRAQLGGLESFRLDNWNLEMLPNGTFTTLVYSVTYSEHTARETITVVESVNDETLGIFGHRIESSFLDAI